MAANVRVSTKFKCLERLKNAFSPCFCYRRTRNQILQLLLHGNYVVAVFQLDLVNIVRSLNKINSQNIVFNTTDVLQLDKFAYKRTRKVF